MRALLLVLALTPLASASDTLDPEAIARGYASSSLEAYTHLELWLPGAAPPRPLPTLAETRSLSDLLEAAARVERPSLHDVHVDERPFLRATSFNARISLLVSLARVQSKMLVDLGTYDSEQESGSTNEHWSGLGAESHQGRTLNLAGGAVVGDLRFLIGTVESQATVAQVLAGDANVGQLNPFKDVSAQFDLAFLALPRGLRKRLAPPLLIVRLSAAYLNAFTRVSSGDSGAGGVDANSEIGIAVGASW